MPERTTYVLAFGSDDTEYKTLGVESRCVLESTEGTLWHGARADVGGHAAAQGVCEVVAGQDLDLVAGEVVQVGDHRGLLGKHLQFHLKAPREKEVALVEVNRLAPLFYYLR